MGDPKPMKVELNRAIPGGCDLRATAFLAGESYLPRQGTTLRLTEMFDYVISEGRFFALKPSDWSFLLGGVFLCGIAALCF